MCLLCIDIQKQRITIREAAKNWTEIYDDSHVKEFMKVLEDMGVKEEFRKELLEAMSNGN